MACRVAVHDLAIQTKANELVVGTHGRSLYVISLNELNSLDSAKLSKGIYVYDLPKHKASKNWGTSFYYWSPPHQTEISIPYYSLKNQAIELTISDSVGMVIFKEKLNGVKGINYFKYTFSANENQSTSKFLRKGKDGKYYLMKGNYKLEMKAEGVVEEKELILEAEKE